MHRQSQVYKFNSSYLITLDCCVAFEYINVFFFPLLSFVLPLRSAWCPEVLLHSHWTPRWVHVMGQQTERCSDVRCVSAQRRGKFFVHKSPQECPENTIIQACFWLLQFVKLCIVKHSPAGSTQSFSQSSHPEWVVALTADTRGLIFVSFADFLLRCLVYHLTHCSYSQLIIFTVWRCRQWPWALNCQFRMWMAPQSRKQ